MSHRILPHHPALYHGKETSRPYFEGWYFKQALGSSAFAVIPGVFHGQNPHEDIAFIQIILEGESRFIRYPYSAFKFNQRNFEIWIGDSFFSFDKVLLNIQRTGLKGRLNFSGHRTLDTSAFSPSIMGPFAYLPAMQCNHGVLSLSHTVNGTVTYKGKAFCFDNADGYIEKDWGEAFPESWIWMQCNNRQTALMCSAATIPYGVFRFIGLICVLWAGGSQYRFATYNGARVSQISRKDGWITVRIRKSGYCLDITAHTDRFGSLIAPTKTGMNRMIKESIDAVYHFTLYYKERTLFSAGLKNGGLEMLNLKTLIERIRL